MKKTSKNNMLNELERKAGKCYRQLKHALPHPWEKQLNRLEKQADWITKTMCHTQFSPKKLVANKNRLLKMALANGNKILGMLNFPTKGDVRRLSARLGQLEKRFRSLGRHIA